MWKKQFYTDQCTKFKGNTKKLWQTINSVAGKQNDKSGIIDCITVDNIDFYEGKQISNEFGKFFSTVGKIMQIKLVRVEPTFIAMLTK